MLIKGLFDNHAVNLDTCVGAYNGAGCATDARLFVGGESVMIAAIVDFLGLERQNVAWTGYNAEIATFAAFGVDGDGTVDFTHLATGFSFMADLRFLGYGVLPSS